MLIRVSLISMLAQHNVIGPDPGKIVAAREALLAEDSNCRERNDPLVVAGAGDTLIVIDWPNESDYTVYRIVDGITLDPEPEEVLCTPKLDDCVIEVIPIGTGPIGLPMEATFMLGAKRKWQILAEAIGGFCIQKSLPTGVDAPAE